jgi:mevalonate kinase
MASAPGKIILLGEHAVVYGRPAIAAPVWETQATATIESRPLGAGCLLVAHDVGLEVPLADAPEDLPLALVTRRTLTHLRLPPDPDWRITLDSDIPIAGGLGSGAALSTALVRAIFAAAGRAADPATVSAFVFESEQFYHGTPSGIDNDVVAYGMPIWFVKGRPPEPFAPGRPLTVAIADSGIRSPTKETVGDVRRGWEADPARYEAQFDAIAALARAGRAAIEQGDTAELGALFDRNHALLQELGVSSPALDVLIAAARAAGALGAKLSGGGRGGNVIALVEEAGRDAVRAALVAAGAQSVIVTTVR